MEWQIIMPKHLSADESGHRILTTWNNTWTVYDGASSKCMNSKHKIQFKYKKKQNVLQRKNCTFTWEKGHTSKHHLLESLVNTDLYLCN